MNSYFHDWLLLTLSGSAVALVSACGGMSTSTTDSTGQGGSGADTSTGTGASRSSTGGGTSAGGTRNGTGASSSSGGTRNVAGTSSSTGGASTGTGRPNVTGGTSSSSGGASNGSGGTTNPLCLPGGNLVIIPSVSGWVDNEDICNDLGLQGSWFAYGDQYPNGGLPRKCLTYGNHMPSECAQIDTPDPTVMGFPNMGGEFRTSGTVERVLPCVAGSMAATIPTSGCFGGGMAGGFDYANMWGAGIGFDFNANAGPPSGDGARHTWDPAAHQVIGISFTIQGVPPAMRVEFPLELTAAEAAADTPAITSEPPTTDDHTAGAPYWGAHADAKFGNSPVVEGENVITWDQVNIPKFGVYVFDTSRLLGIRFHLPTNSVSASMYSFAISNVTFLRHL